MKYRRSSFHLGSDSMQEQKISGSNTPQMQSDSQMPYRNLFFFKLLNMKKLLNKNKSMTQDY